MKLNLKLNLEFSGIERCKRCGSILQNRGKCDNCNQYQSGDDDCAPGFSTGW